MKRSDRTMERSDCFVKRSDCTMERSDCFVERSDRTMERSDCFVERSDRTIERSDRIGQFFGYIGIQTVSERNSSTLTLPLLSHPSKNEQTKCLTSFYRFWKFKIPGTGLGIIFIGILQVRLIHLVFACIEKRSRFNRLCRSTVLKYDFWAMIILA